MKFDCDKWKRRRREKFHARLLADMQWHRVFAVYQKIGPGDCRVMETIERRLFRINLKSIRKLTDADVYDPYSGDWYRWEYRACL